MNLFSIRFEKAIQENNTTKKEIAKALNCSTKTICNWVKGITTPTIMQIRDLAILLDTSTDYLFGLTNDRLVIKIYNSFNNNNGNIEFKG